MKDDAPAPSNINCFGENLVKEWKKYNSLLTKVSNHFIIVSDMITMISENINKLSKLYDHKHYNHEHVAGHGASSSSTGLSVNPTICLTTPFPPIERLLAEEYSGEKVTENGNVSGLFTQDYFFVKGPEFLTSPTHDSLFNIPDNVNWQTFNEYSSSCLQTAFNPKPTATDIMPPKPSQNYKRNELFPIVKSDPVINENTWPEGSYTTGIIDTNVTSNISPSTKNLIRKLISELATEVDKDGNGLIYGIHFIIDPADPMNPPILTRIRNAKLRNRDINISKGLLKPAVQYPKLYSWNDYLLTLGLGIPNTIIDLKVPTRTKTQIISDLINEALTLTDYDNDGFVYSRDFIIVGPNTPIELKSKYPVLLPNILLTWDAYLSYSQYQFNNMNIEDWIDLLLSEYDTKKDLDGNGKVFGIDFLISNPNDNIEYGLKIDNPLPTRLFNLIGQDVPRINWNEYIITLNVFPEQSKAYYYDELSVKLSTEFNSVKNKKPKDMDDNNLIYGLDFMLIDYCSDKTGYLWDIEDNERFIIKRDITVLKKLKDMFDLPKYMKESYTISDYESIFGPYVIDDSDIDELESYPYPYESEYKECINNIRIKMMRYSNNNPKQNLSNVPKSLKFPKNILLITWSDLLKINNLRYEI